MGIGDFLGTAAGYAIGGPVGAGVGALGSIGGSTGPGFSMQNFLLGSNGATTQSGMYNSPYADQGQMQKYIQAGMSQAAPQLDPSQQAQFRAMQMAQAQQLQGVASGQQQGAGELAVQRQVANAQAAQQAQAMMARGGQNAALAYRGAANAQAGIGLQGAGQSQQAAMQDQMQAQGLLSGALQNGRQGDIGFAGQNAQLQAGQNQLQLGYTNALGTMDANQLNAQTAAFTAGQQNKGLLGSLISAGGQAASAGATGGAGAAGAAGGAGGAGAAIASDKRLKTDVRDGGPDIDAMLDALHAKSYRYKDGKMHGEGERAGVMAQDLKRTRAGSAVVRDMPYGLGLDSGKAISIALASAARLNERLRKIEGEHGRAAR